MRRKRLLWLAAMAGLAALLLPIALSALWAQRSGERGAVRELEQLSTDVLRRSDAARKQIHTALYGMTTGTQYETCTPPHIDRLRSMAAGSSYLQALAVVSGDTVLCTTLSSQAAAALPLGPADAVARDGTRAWSDVTLPGSPGTRFNLTERNGYAAIVVPGLVIDILPESSEIVLAEFATGARHLLRSHGQARAQWLSRYDGQAATFSEGGYRVAVTPSRSGETAVLAAMPEAGVAAAIRAARWRALPVGLLAGLLLAGGIALLARRLASVKAELQGALDRKEFYLLYQPVMDLRNGRCVGAEALIRWSREDGQPVSPAVFIPAAEANGLIRQVTGQVMEMVALEAADVIRQYPRTHIAINVSAEDLHTAETETRLRELIETAGLSADNILVEATERGFMFPEKARDVLISVRAQGFKVAIDDFGTGNSSLSYLATYDLDYLKIDKSFVDALGVDEAGTRVAFHIIEMARSLGLKMIAEGVETDAQRLILRERGVQYAQGWVFAKPMPMAELAAFIRRCNGPAPGIGPSGRPRSRDDGAVDLMDGALPA